MIVDPTARFNTTFAIKLKEAAPIVGFVVATSVSGRGQLIWCWRLGSR
jgi:hypothetical protein